MDTYHFFEAARLAITLRGWPPLNPFGIAIAMVGGTVAGLIEEIRQYMDPAKRPSFLSYEDLPLNELGLVFGSFLIDGTKDFLPLSAQFFVFMVLIGASTNPETTIKSKYPGAWETIPE